MIRKFFVIAAGGILLLSVHAVQPAAARQITEETPQRLSAKPPAPVTDLQSLVNEFGRADSLNDAQLLSRLARLYQFQTQLLQARAENDQEGIDMILTDAMTELGRLIQYDYLRSEARVEAVYRVLIAEYEFTYGPSDSMLVAVGDIYGIRNDLFAALETVRDPLLEDVISRQFQPVVTTVPMPMNRLVESSISYLLKEPDKHLNHWLSRGDTYLPMIEQIFAEVGIPDELKYLAMIESGLNPRARSWARAVGMWQFIAATGQHYGLEVNTWVDDRMDPEKATRAAALHLKDLYAQYGDWHIALAGYNCSPRCIKRAIRRSNANGTSNPTYWDIYPYLPRETRGYIPMFIAAALIASNPDAFNVPPVKPGPAYSYHQVPVQGMLSLSDLAEMAGTDETTLKALNPNLRRGSLPPSMSVFYLRIPVGTYDTFSAAYDALPESVKKQSGEYIVRSGDTLGKIGNEFGVSVSMLMQRNGLTTTRIRIGQRLVVPVSEYAAPQPDMALASSDGSVIEYGRPLNRPIISKKETPPARPTGNIVLASTSESSGPSSSTSSSNTTASATGGKSRTVYTVKRGDTLGRIASRFGVTIAQLQSWNSLSGTRIKVNERLAIYADGEGSEPAPSSSTINYRVISGDTLGKIAARNGVTVNQLRQWNGIRGSQIRVGQRLVIYTGSGRSSVQHTVRSGDTLIGIAGKYAVSVGEIKSWNELRSNTIRVGQEITIFQ